MVCNKCGAETVEDAVFCGMCGARVDGKKACVHCGALNDEKYAFCTQCGARIDGKTACANCGEVYEGNYCPACGRSGEEKAKPALVKTQKNAWKGMENTKKIVDIVGGACGMLAVLFSMVFVFFIGLKIKLNMLGQDMSDMVQEISGIVGDEKIDIFYYFGQSFKDLKTLNLNQTMFVDWALYQAETTINIFGLIIGILALLSVAVFAVIAIIVYVRGWLGKTEQCATGWTIACVTAFLASVIAFYALHNCKAEMSVGVISASAGIALNGATKIGIIFSLIFLGLALLCRLFVAGRYALKTKYLVKAIVSLFGLGLLITALCLMKNAGVSIAGKEDELQMSIRAGFGQMSTLMASMVMDADGSLVKKLMPSLLEMLTLNGIVQGLTMGVIIACVATMGIRFANISSDKASSGMVFSVIWLVLATALLVFAILAKNNMVEFFETYNVTETTVKGLGWYITVLVLSVVDVLTSLFFIIFYRQKTVE